MRKTLILAVIMIFAFLLAAWAPWITPVRAEMLAKQAFESGRQAVVDGCGFNCNGCGVTGASKTMFGARVEIEYACGMLPSDSPEYHQRASGFVSLFGTIHGLPRP